MTLKKFDYLTRSQIQTIHRLGSVRNANRVLKEMSEYLSSFRDIENVYYLNKEGRERVEATKIRKKTLQAKHFIMRNDLYIKLGYPSTWKNEIMFEVKDQVKVIADSIFIKNGRYHIVEVDHMQKMSKNKGKIERYKKLISLNVFEKDPYFIWITTTEYRRKQILSLSEGLDAQVYTTLDFN